MGRVFLPAIIKILLLVPAVFSANETSSEPTVLLNFNTGWGYCRGTLEEAEKVDFDDSGFIAVTIPHTVRLEKKHCNGAENVYRGEGWYRRYFTLAPEYRDKRVNIDFEGVMIDSEVYLNGEKLFTRNGGYIGFSVDITDKVNREGNNVLAVRFSNRDNPDTPPGKPLANLDFHYYGGIYRDVKLRITPDLHITEPLQAGQEAGGGIFITYPSVSSSEALVNVKTHVANDGSRDRTVKVRSTLVDRNGREVASAISGEEKLESGTGSHFSSRLKVVKPELWHPDSPYLYSLVCEVMEGENVIDRRRERAGIRHLDFKPDGFYINGKKFFIRGANRHQCYPYIGDAAPNSMQRRDAVQMRKNGFNSVRAAHYPQDTAFLDACDELGILVITCQPGWQFFGQSKEFYNNTLRDTREMIRRDRNHPSVILWEASLNETWVSEDWARQATETAHREYPGGQIFTAADYGFHGKLYDVCYKVVDRNQGVEKDADPEKPFFTREWGDWGHQSLRANGEAPMLNQVRNRQKQLNGEGYTDWGGLDACKRIGGYWLWSWNDYPRGGSPITLGSGAVDHDRYEKYSAWWLSTMVLPGEPSFAPVVYVASTNSPESSLEVDVYTNCDSVRFYRNGKLMGTQTREQALVNLPNMAAKGSTPYFTFKLPSYEKGELKAEAIQGGKVAAVHSVRTPGRPERIVWEFRNLGETPVADGSDLVPLHFKVLDRYGTVVPDYKGTVRVSVEGEGELVGEKIARVGAENQAPDGGIGFVFVRTTMNPGKIRVKAEAQGLKAGTLEVQSSSSQEKFVPEGKRIWNKGEYRLENEREPGHEIAEEVLPGKIVPDSAIEKISASSMESADRDVDKLRDGVTLIGTGWLALGTACPQTVTLELKKPYTLKGSRIYWEKDSSQYCYDLEVSTDGSTWTKLLPDRRVGGQFFKPESFEEPAGNVKYVRVVLKEVVSGGVVDKIGMSEWVLYGEEE